MLLCSNKRSYWARFQINSSKHIATEFIKSNKLLYASPVERLIAKNKPPVQTKEQ